MNGHDVHVEVLGIAELVEALKLSVATIRRLERAGEFPPRRRITPGRVGWLRSDVTAWLESRPTVNSTR